MLFAMQLQDSLVFQQVAKLLCLVMDTFETLLKLSNLCFGVRIKLPNPCDFSKKKRESCF